MPASAVGRCAFSLIRNRNWLSSFVIFVGHSHPSFRPLSRTIAPGCTMSPLDSYQVSTLGRVRAPLSAGPSAPYQSGRSGAGRALRGVRNAWTARWVSTMSDPPPTDDGLARHNDESTDHSRSASNPPTLAELLVEQTRRWRHGERPRVEVFLERVPCLRTDVDALLDLIHHEVSLREEFDGERAELD